MRICGPKITKKLRKKFNSNPKNKMKRKYPDVNLNHAPTNKDLEFGAIAARIAVEHSVLIAGGKWDGVVLSEKIARALKKFRIEKKNLKQKMIQSRG